MAGLKHPQFSVTWTLFSASASSVLERSSIDAIASIAAFSNCSILDKTNALDLKRIAYKFAVAYSIFLDVSRSCIL